MKNTTDTMKTNTVLPVRITPHHLTLSPTLVAKVQREVGSLVRFGENITRADVVLRLHHGKSHGKLFSASARLSLPGRDIHASATHANLYTAISTLENRLARRLRKRKTRMENRVNAASSRRAVAAGEDLQQVLLPA